MATSWQAAPEASARKPPARSGQTARVDVPWKLPASPTPFRSFVVSYGGLPLASVAETAAALARAVEAAERAC